MTFLNWTMLLALGAVAIPIVIHLLNRRRAKAVEWGAMRFLTASLASRNQRILLEEILLMTLRCLTVALIVLAVARPYLPSRSGVSWMLVLPAVLAGAVLAAVGAVLRGKPLVRWSCWLLAAAMLIGAGALSSYEQLFQKNLWAVKGGEKDIAIVIDASGSMTLSGGGATNFQRAIEEARGVVESCKSGDAVSVILAGPVPRTAIPAPAEADYPAPSFNLKEVAAKLPSLAPIGGSQSVHQAFDAAVVSLLKGHNPRKKIVYITDSQDANWNVANDSRWQALEATLKTLPERPDIVVRTLSLPKSFRNVAVADVHFSRGIIGTDRPVTVEVKVANTGTVTVGPQLVELRVDDAQAAAPQALGQLAANGSESVSFSVQFAKAGPHVVSVQVAHKASAGSTRPADDDLPSDNQALRVVHVVDTLAVLIVDGAPSTIPLEGAADRIALALSPSEDTLQQLDAGPNAAAGAAANGATGAPDDPNAKPAALPRPAQASRGMLVAPTVVSAPELADCKSFAPYRLVVLANVPKLSATAAEALARFVHEGGGLLIAPGDKAQSGFYNQWVSPTGQRVSPATLGDSRVVPNDAVRVNLKSFAHPVLRLLADTPRSDVAQTLVKAYWPLTLDEHDKTVRAAGLMHNGLPLLVERKVGSGYVLLSAIAMDCHDSNLPKLNCFLPLVHEMVQYLSLPLLPECNLPASADIKLTVPLDMQELAALKPLLAAERTLAVGTPSGRRATAAIVDMENSLTVRIRHADEPGLYRLMLPGDPDMPKSQAASLPLVVLSDPAESKMGALSDADLQRIARHMPLLHVNSPAELTAAIDGDVPGQELWRILAVAAAVFALLEIALTRRIAMARRTHKVQTVQFGSNAARTADLRQRAKAMVAVPDAAAGNSKLETRSSKQKGN